MNKDILRIQDYSLDIKNDNGLLKILKKVSLRVGKNERVGLVGESGCGKSSLARSILALERSPYRFETGQIEFKGKNLLQYSEAELSQVRGNEIAMIFQEPRIYLNPLFRIRKQMLEILKLHGKNLKKKNEEQDLIYALESAGLKGLNILQKFPHELSGGQLQRIMIAMAMLMKPDLIIADEPTTALDLALQKQIMEVLCNQLSKDKAILFISHDLGLVSAYTDRVYVIYGGEILEEGKTSSVLKQPGHPYTKALLDCSFRENEWRSLKTIEGKPPSLNKVSEECIFIDRCLYRKDFCKEKPVMRFDSEQRGVACHFPFESRKE